MDAKKKIHDKIAEVVHRDGMCWGCLVSDAAEVLEAKALGASWLVASHAGKLSRECPGSVIGLMPFANANDIVLKMGASLAQAAGDTPLLAGVLATDQFQIMDTFIDRLKRAGYAGVQNFPSIGIVSGKVRTLLESSDMGYDCEVRLIRKASEKGLFCSAIVFGQGDAGTMVEAGADMLVAHLPLTENGDIRKWDHANVKVLARLRDETLGRANVVLTAGFVNDSVKTFEGAHPGNEHPTQYERVGGAGHPLKAVRP